MIFQRHATPTYRSLELAAPMTFRLVDRPVRMPASGMVRVDVRACRVSARDVLSDASCGGEFPRTPGGEAVGVVEEIGDAVEGWRVGQWVAVGFGERFGQCGHASGSSAVSCLTPSRSSGRLQEGACAEMMLTSTDRIASLPSGLIDVAPVVALSACVVIADALARLHARPIDLVAVVGATGLGSLAIQFARQMGFHVVALEAGESLRGEARRLGAHHYVDYESQDASMALLSLGGAVAVLCTGGSCIPLGGLRYRGRMLAVERCGELTEIGTLGLSPSQFRQALERQVGDQEVFALMVAEHVAAATEVYPLGLAERAFKRSITAVPSTRVALCIER